jgi:hypothetical protein
MLLSIRAVPYDPEEPDSRRCPLLGLPVLGFGLSDGLAAPDWRNEADLGSLALRLASSLGEAGAELPLTAEASSPESRPTTPGLLHGKRAIPWQTPFILRET